MTKGLGNDLIEIARLQEAHKEHGQAFLDRIYTKKEQEYCFSQKDPYPRFAGRFAAKEAVSKAFGCGFGAELSWHDIEILADEKGKPVVHILGKLQKQFASPKVLVTITHCKDYASAVALWLE